MNAYKLYICYIYYLHSWIINIIINIVIASPPEGALNLSSGKGVKLKEWII